MSNHILSLLLRLVVAQSVSEQIYNLDELPKSIGVVGVGTIGSAVVRGLLSSPAGYLPHVPNFVLSPRDASKAAALRAEFPNSTRICESDQEVVDSADCIILALPGGVAEPVMKSLRFHDGQQVISLIAALELSTLQQLTGPRVNCTKALPLPAVASRQGTTLGFPPKPFADAIFSALGTYTAVTDEALFKRMAVATSFMGDFYKRQLTIQEWLTSNGVPSTSAASYLGALFATFAADTKDAAPTTFAEKVAEQTPGGLNEMVWKEQQQKGVYAAVNESLDAVYRRSNPRFGEEGKDHMVIV